MQHFHVSKWWCGEQRLGVLAMSSLVHCPQMIWECVSVCGRNELEACATLAYPHVSVHFVHMHPQTIWGQWTDGAKSGYCRIFNMLMRVRGCSNTVCTGCWLWKTKPCPCQGLNLWQYCAWLFGPLLAKSIIKWVYNTELDKWLGSHVNKHWFMIFSVTPQLRWVFIYIYIFVYVATCGHCNCQLVNSNR